MKRSSGRPKTKKADQRREVIRVLVTSDQKKTLTDAAARSGLSASSWLLSICLAAAEPS